MLKTEAVKLCTNQFLLSNTGGDLKHVYWAGHCVKVSKSLEFKYSQESIYFRMFVLVVKTPNTRIMNKIENSPKVSLGKCCSCHHQSHLTLFYAKETTSPPFDNIAFHTHLIKMYMYETFIVYIYLYLYKTI